MLTIAQSCMADKTLDEARRKIVTITCTMVHSMEEAGYNNTLHVLSLLRMM